MTSTQFVIGAERRIANVDVFIMQTPDTSTPSVYVESFANVEDGLTSAQARKLAAAILDAADEADHWR